MVARSHEAKAIGIKEGIPYFQLAEQFPNQKIAVFSSNYELYGELTSKVVSIISQEAPSYFRYSIDECFVYLDGMENIDRLDKVIDRINRCYGSETIVIGSQQYTQKNGKGKAEVFANAIKHDFKSKNPTTRWSDIIRLK